jgi:RNA polymerase sigma-70 factor (ECF subfamily)
MGGSVRRIYEQVLVVRCQAGDDDAFVELAARYHARLASFVRRLLGRDGPVDDVLQEVWLAALGGLPRLAHPAAFRTWLYRIARNKACEHLRSQADWQTLDEVDPPAAPADEPVLAAEEAGLLGRALGRLSLPHREVLALRFLEGMTYDEVARVVGCPVGTVRSRLHYARDALRRTMEAMQ